MNVLSCFTSRAPALGLLLHHSATTKVKLAVFRLATTRRSRYAQRMRRSVSPEAYILMLWRCPDTSLVRNTLLSAHGHNHLGDFEVICNELENTMLWLASLPEEIILAILTESARTRSIKRALRLRLVCRQLECNQDRDLNTTLI
jgi:hypothetical protein